MVAIHQFLPSFVDHDAIGTHVRHLRRIIQDLGVESDVFAWEWRGQRSQATSYKAFAPKTKPDDTWILFHMSTASEVSEFVRNRPEHLALNYHNISPANLIGPWEPTIGRELDEGREQLRSLAERSELSIGVSKFNEEELRLSGYRNTAVAPVLFDPGDFGREPDRKVERGLHAAKEKGGSDWLFVGRIAPHKCQHDIIKAFALYRRLYDPQARLHLVGGIASHLYWTTLHRYIDALRLQDAVQLTNSVSDAALSAYYRNADVFVCLSEHEGFGVPVLEAMHDNVPVLAFDAAAVAETTGRGGIVLKDKAPATVAAAACRILKDASLREELLMRGKARLDDFTLRKSEARWRELIHGLVVQ